MNLLLIDINWPQLKALHQLYTEGRTKTNLFSNAYINRLRTDKRLLKYKSDNRGIIESNKAFKDFYELNFLKAYQKYLEFFQHTGVQSDGRRPYSIYDLETLLYIQDNKDNLRPSLTTERTFSAQLFKGSKYLENNTSVLKAVLKILDIDSFPKSDPKEQKWRLVIDCINPQCVLLCENLAALKYPNIAIDLNIELWYVGGNNTGILDNISTTKLNLPIYYMCDWDYDGLRIFSNVKKIIAEKGSMISLLMPFDLSKRLSVDSPYHNSEWKSQFLFSGLELNDFTDNQQKLIRDLISTNQWIEEEGQDFEKLLVYNNVLGDRK